MPDDDPIVAIPVLPLVHTPAVGVLDKVSVPPMQTGVGTKSDGDGLTVIVLVASHPVGKVYIIVSVPAVRPLTEPEVPIVAKAVLLLLQVPPNVPSISEIDVPVHRLPAPPIDAGNEFIFTVVVAVLVQPDPLVTLYDITGVPAAMPVTIPVVPTDPDEGRLLLHVPPGVTSLKVVDVPTQIFTVPVIAATVGKGLTVIIVVALQPVSKV